MDTSTDASNQSREFSSSTVSYLEAQYQEFQLLLLQMNRKISQAVDDKFVHPNQITTSNQLTIKFNEQVFRSGSKPFRGVLKKGKHPRFKNATSEKKQNYKQNSESLIANQDKGEPVPKVQEQANIDQQGSQILEGAPEKNPRLKAANIKDGEKQPQLGDDVLKMDANKKESKKNEKLQNKVESQNQSEKNNTRDIISISRYFLDNDSEISQIRAGGVANTSVQEIKTMKKEFRGHFDKLQKEMKGIRQILEKILTILTNQKNGEQPAH